MKKPVKITQTAAYNGRRTGEFFFGGGGSWKDDVVWEGGMAKDDLRRQGGGGGQKSPILRRHSLWTAPYCTAT